MKRRNTTPAIPPFIDPWGRPTYENPFGHNRPNPALTAKAELAASTRPEAQPEAVEPVLPKRDRTRPVNPTAKRQRRSTIPRRVRRHTAIVVMVLASMVAASAVFAYFTAHGTGAGAASTSTLAAPTGVNTTYTSGTTTVQVNWTSPTAPGPGTVKYYVQRFVGSTPSAACGTSPTVLITSVTCNDTSVPDGTYTYEVTAVYNSWSSTSSPSSAVTVHGDITPPNLPVIISPRTSGANSGTFSNGVFNTSTWGTGCTPPATICGTASDNVGGSGVQKTQLELIGTSGTNNNKYWNGGAFVSGTPTFFDASGTANWSYQLTLPADGGYTLTAKTIDNANNVGSTTTESITIDTVIPVAPAPGVTATVTSGSNPVFVNSEAVNLADSPTDTGGSGVHSVAYSYCAGTSGACTTTPIGTSTSGGTWAVTSANPFATPDGPYRIFAVATENAGNVSAPSSATLVTVDTTAPVVSRPIVNGHS